MSHVERFREVTTFKVVFPIEIVPSPEIKTIQKFPAYVGVALAGSPIIRLFPHFLTNAGVL